MMESLALSEADIVTIANVTLKKGTFCKLRPHSKEFLEISDHRAVYVVWGRRARAWPPTQSATVAH